MSPTGRRGPGAGAASNENGAAGGLSGVSIAPTPGEATHGAQLADQNADAGWRGDAWRALETLAWSGRPFTADDLLKLVQLPDAPCRVGGLFMAASRSGLIECVGAVPSRRASRHGGLQRQWRGAAVARAGEVA